MNSLPLFLLLLNLGSAQAGIPGRAASPPDTSQAIAFLELLKSGEDAAARAGGFDVSKGGYWNGPQLIRALDSHGVTFFDINGDSTWHRTLANMRYEQTHRSGAAFRMLVHLGHIYGHPDPQYSKLTFSVEEQSVIVSVGEWYRVTFVLRGQRLRVSKIEYVMKEVD